MNTVLGLLKNKAFYAVVFSVLISLAFVSYIATAATTISTNITTGGTLTVSGASTLTGDITATGDIFASSTLAVTGKAFFYDQLALDSAAADPTGVTAGSLYWNTAESLIRVYDGANWRTVASSTSGNDGLTNSGAGVRFNTVATGHMALGTTTLPVVSGSGNSLLFLNSTTTASIPLLIQGIAAQTGDLVRLLNGVNTELFAIDHSGNASTTMLGTTGRFVNALTVSGYATTSGSTGNFATEGTLSVTGTGDITGNVTLNGNVTLGNALADVITITGAATSTNSLNVGGVLSVNGNATTTSSGNLTIVGTLGVATTTPSLSAQLGVTGNVHLGSAATTTLSLHTSVATRGTCIQMVASDGNLVRIFVNNADALVVEVGPCSAGGTP